MGKLNMSRCSCLILVKARCAMAPEHDNDVQVASAPASSGFTMPRARPGDYPYHVKRAPSWMLPVYVSQVIMMMMMMMIMMMYVSQPVKNAQPQSTITVIR